MAKNPKSEFFGRDVYLAAEMVSSRADGPAAPKDSVGCAEKASNSLASHPKLKGTSEV